MSNWLDLSLTVEQQLELEKMRRYAPLMSREKLEEFCLEVAKQSFRYQNAMKSLMKNQ